MKGESEIRVVTFKLGNEQYGILVQNVREIIKARNYTKVPNAPSYLEGVINLRGQILPVINLKRLLNVETANESIDMKLDEEDKAKQSSQARIIVAELDEEDIGLLVDQVIGVMQVDKENIVPAPSYIKSNDAHFIDSIIKNGEDLIMLLNIKNLLSKNSLEHTHPYGVEEHLGVLAKV